MHKSQFYCETIRLNIIQCMRIRKIITDKREPCETPLWKEKTFECWL